MGFEVKDNPSLYCFKAWNISNGINETATISKYGIARFTTFFGWSSIKSKGLSKIIARNKKNPRIKHIKKPFTNDFFKSMVWFLLWASATTGVIAAEKPIPIDIAIKIKLFPNETAARFVGSNFPTIILSIIPTRVCPNKPKIIGYESFKL